MFNVYPDGEHCLTKLYVQEILHKAAINTTGAAIITVPKTSASNITYIEQPNHPTTPLGREVPSGHTTPRSEANKRMRAIDVAELDSTAIAALRHYNLCQVCGDKGHDRSTCPYSNNPASASWLNEYIPRSHIRKSRGKTPNWLSDARETIDWHYPN